jgi:hypothetical protein
VRKNIYDKEYYAVNFEKIKKKRAHWFQNNKHRGCLASAKRKAAKLQRTPKWLSDKDKHKIDEIYRLRPGYHVDHIVPLQGVNVSGLHVPWNLQYLIARENYVKNNSHHGVGDHPDVRLRKLAEKRKD